MGLSPQAAAAVPQTGAATTFGVLGALEATRAGVRLELPRSAKTRALLGYLLVEARPLSRQHLCSLLWDGADDPRGGLRWSLSRLRPLLHRPSLRATREEAGVESDSTSVDLWRIRKLLHAGGAQPSATLLREALALFRGPLLEGLDVRDAFRFQAWLTRAREEAQAQQAGLFRLLVEALAEEPESALPHARALLALEPADEGAHRSVIRLLGNLGRRAVALEQYETCRAVLAHTRGTRPSAETEAVRRSLGVGEATAPVALVRPSAARPPFVGRQAERVLLERALLAPTPTARAWLILGEAGIGKTRLLDELGFRATGTGATVLRGRAFEAELVRPYGVWVDALRAAGFLRDVPPALRGDLSALFGELGPAPETVDRTRLYDALAALLRHALPEARGVVMLDDVQWLDEASATLVHYLLRALPELRVALAARPGELRDNASLQPVLRALRHDAELAELELLPFGPGDVAGLIAAQGWTVDVERVHRASEGNPLLALEVARALNEGRPLLDDTLEQLVLRRVADVDVCTRTLLEKAATLGRRWPLAHLARVSSEVGAGFLEELAPLERRGIVRPLPDGERYEFGHDLVREAIYQAIPPARRRLLHRGVAEALAGELETSPAISGTVAHHALLGESAALAVRASIVAGRHALRVSAAEEALGLADRALVQLGHLPRAEGLRARMALHEVRLLSRRLEAKEVERTRREVLSLLDEAEALGAADVEALGFTLLSLEAYVRHDPPTALPMSMRGARAGAQAADPEVRARALAQAARCLAQLAREPERCVELLDQAEEAARRVALRVTDIPLARGLLAQVLGQSERAQAELERAADLARELGDAWRESEALFAQARADLEQGDLRRARLNIERVLPVTTQLLGGSEPAYAQGLLALVTLREAEAEGRNSELAARDFDTACAELERLDAGFRIVRLALLRAEGDLDAERLVDIDKTVRRVASFLPSLEEAAVTVEVLVFLAGAALARGQHAEARDNLRRAQEAVAAGVLLPAALRERLHRVATQLPEA